MTELLFSGTDADGVKSDVRWTVELIFRFEVIRRLLGHQVVLRTLAFPDWLEDETLQSGVDALRQYEARLKALLVNRDRSVSPQLPVVEPEKRIAFIVTSTRKTHVVLTSTGIRLHRPYEPFSFGSGRDVAILWVAGRDARRLFDPEGGYQGGPTQLAILEATARLAALGLTDEDIEGLALAAGDSIEIERVWESITTFMWGELLRQNSSLWDGYKARFPAAELPAHILLALTDINSRASKNPRELYRQS